MRRRALLVLAVLAVLLWSAFYPYMLTDGDSCLYAAMARDLARGDAWAAPQWAYQDGVTCFHENPPGLLWPAALLLRCGLSDRAAPVLANTLALLAVAAGLWHLSGALAAGVWLLHWPVLHYAVRFGLELHFAAWFVAALAFLRTGFRWRFLAVGAALAGAALTRGAFALALPPLLWLARDRRGDRRQALFGCALAVLLLLGFDAAHRAASGHGFWARHYVEYLVPSLQEGGTPHSNSGSTIVYYGSRLLLYGLPWWLLSLRAWRRGARPARGDLRLVLAWIGLITAGAMLGRREGSRYLFAVWPAAAWLCAMLHEREWRGPWPPLRRLASAAILCLPPALVAGKSLVTPRDDWWRSAAALRAARAELAGAPRPAIYGAFLRRDDRRKQFLRYHAGLWAFPQPEAGAPSGAWRCLEPEEAPPSATLGFGPVRLVRVP